jgi:thiamine biosynthesis lipoprotein
MVFEFKKYEWPLHWFSHTAMAANFEIGIAHEDRSYCGQAALEAFRYLDRLDMELSRFHPNGDISRINNFKPGEFIPTSLDTFLCLVKAREMTESTGGAFDPTAGWLKDFFAADSDAGSRIPEIGMRHVCLNETNWTVALKRPVRLDLGAIGKGYACDRMGELLREWEIADALIHGGASSVLAMGKLPGCEGWPLSIRDPGNGGLIISHPLLNGRGMGASGVQRGRHIIDPRSRRPAGGAIATWAEANDAAAADALSTAFMVMDEEEIGSFCAAHPDVKAVAVFREGDRTRVVRWENELG